jgi:hypothetical protein
MPRIPEPELQRLKGEVSVQRLVEAGGVEHSKSVLKSERVKAKPLRGASRP